MEENKKGGALESANYTGLQSTGGNLEIIERYPEKDSGKPPVVFVHGAFI